MNERWKKILLILLAVLLVAALAVLAGMVVMAVRFGELGRVLVYGFLIIISLEILIVVISRLIKRDDT